MYMASATGEDFEELLQVVDSRTNKDRLEAAWARSSLLHGMLHVEHFADLDRRRCTAGSHGLPKPCVWPKKEVQPLRFCLWQTDQSRSRRQLLSIRKIAGFPPNWNEANWSSDRPLVWFNRGIGGLAELADAEVSKTSESNLISVRFRYPPPFSVVPKNQCKRLSGVPGRGRG